MLSCDYYLNFTLTILSRSSKPTAASVQDGIDPGSDDSGVAVRGLFVEDDCVMSTSEVTNCKKKKIMMVFVVGGLSFLEVAALRYLSNDPLFPFSIVIGTTAFVNGNSLLESMAHEF